MEWKRQGGQQTGFFAALRHSSALGGSNLSAGGPLTTPPAEGSPVAWCLGLMIRHAYMATLTTTLVLLLWCSKLEFPAQVELGSKPSRPMSACCTPFCTDVICWDCMPLQTPHHWLNASVLWTRACIQCITQTASTMSFEQRCSSTQWCLDQKIIITIITVTRFQSED